MVPSAVSFVHQAGVSVSSNLFTGIFSLQFMESFR